MKTMDPQELENRKRHLRRWVYALMLNLVAFAALIAACSVQ
jgi:hypothetical protein